MIELDRLKFRELVRDIIKDELQVIVEHEEATSTDYAKIRVRLWLNNAEISYAETRIYGS